MTETVRDNPALSRFELGEGDALAVAHYRIADGAMIFTHTEVPRHLRGQGVATRLIAGALDAVRARGLRIVPLCSFVADYLERHPEAGDAAD